MGERRGLEAELQRLGRIEREVPQPKEGLFAGKKKRPRPKGGSPGQMGKVAPAATGLYEPPEEEPAPVKSTAATQSGAPAKTATPKK